MIEMDFKTLAEKVEGRLLNAKFKAARFRGAGIDSRTIKADHLFIAIKGTKNDGHKYLADALEKKCGGMLVNNDHAPAWEYQAKSPIVVVENTHNAMMRLAGQHRSELKGKIAAITGSNGKTTTKEIAWAIINSKNDKAYKSRGNLNNLFGLPLTIFEIPEDSEYVILELGISIKGEMTRLAEMARPDIILITNIGPTHLETLGSVAGVAEAKFELVDAAKEEVPIIINADDSAIMQAAEKRKRNFITFGFEHKADFKGRLGDILKDGRMRLFIDGRRVAVNLFGVHQAYNVLAGYATAKTLGLDIIPDELNEIDFATESYRGEIEHFDGLTVVADCYNANPVSMKSGLKSFHKYFERNRKENSRGIAVVGDMLELGQDSAKFHEEIGALLAELNFDLNIAVGPLSEEIFNGAIKAGLDSEKIMHFADVAVAGNRLIENIKRGDIVYLKASRGIGLEKLITLLKGSAFRQN